MHEESGHDEGDDEGNDTDLGGEGPPRGEERPARPWDLWNKDIGRVAEEVTAARLAVCKGCDRYFSLMHLCVECGCVMEAKALLPNAYCPLRKWTTAPAAPRDDER